jgi:hypothetical protein
MNGVTWRLGHDSALGLANTIHGPAGHRRHRAADDEPGHDHLETAEAARDFLVSHEVPAPPELPTAGQLARLRALRTSIRALASADPPDPGRWRHEVRAAFADIHFRLDGEALRSVATGWDGVIDDLFPAAIDLADRSDRLRTCGNPRCRFLFVDRSRRGSRIWCEMAVCGNRMKVGRHRLALARGPALPVQPPR